MAVRDENGHIWSQQDENLQTGPAGNKDGIPPDHPRLSPTGEGLPSAARLLRRPGQLPDDQFDLLAAARSEGDLEGEALEEMEEILMTDPEKRERADSFRRVRLKPAGERWPGLSASLKPVPAVPLIRRVALTAALAAAAVALILIGPATGWQKRVQKEAGPDLTAKQQVAEIVRTGPITVRDPGSENSSDPQTKGEAAANESAYSLNQPPPGQSASPLNQLPPGQSTPPTKQAPPGQSAPPTNLPTPGQGAPPSIQPSPGQNAPPSIQPLSEKSLPLLTTNGLPVMKAVAVMPVPELTGVTLTEPVIAQPPAEERNWILRSISFMAKAITGREKEITSFGIARGCINGINRVLGWEMELEQLRNDSGEPVAVSFNSSLLSFRRPLKEKEE